jgi:hypothetical protein
MRSQVSHQVDNSGVKSGEGRVLLKLYNLLIRELGPGLLRKGVWIAARRLGEFFERQPESFWSECEKARLNGCPVKAENIKNGPWTGEDVFLRLEEN